MNFESWDDASSWVQFADHILWILAPILVAFIPTVVTINNRKTLKEVKNQVVNGHSDPLRTDLDRVIVMVNDIARNVAEIREDLSEERSHRRSSDEDLRNEICRIKGHIQKD